jgi:hypothetical protein
VQEGEQQLGLAPYPPDALLGGGGQRLQREAGTARPPWRQRACQRLAVRRETPRRRAISAWEWPWANRWAACRRRCRAAWGLRVADGGGLDGEGFAMTIASQHAKPANVTPFYEPL